MECTKWPLVEGGKRKTKQAVKVLACHIVHISSSRWPAFWSESDTVIINAMYVVLIMCKDTVVLIDLPALISFFVPLALKQLYMYWPMMLNGSYHVIASAKLALCASNFHFFVHFTCRLFRFECNMYNFFFCYIAG